MARTRFKDLDPYDGCGDADILGIAPLGVGWLHRKQPFTTGSVSPKFIKRLLTFCEAAHTVCETPKARPCPLGCGRAITVAGTMGDIELGGSELRAIGPDDIYAAPTLIYHYVTEHAYQPPAEFVAAIMDGPQPGTSTHKAIVTTLRSHLL